MAKNMRDVAYCTIGPEPSVPAPDRMAGARLLPLYRFYLKIRQTPVGLSYLRHKSCTLIINDMSYPPSAWGLAVCNQGDTCFHLGQDRPIARR